MRASVSGTVAEDAIRESLYEDESMKDDPIVREVRRIRQEHAARFKYNVDLIAKDLKAQERASSQRYIGLPPRRTEKPANQPPDTARDPSETAFLAG